MMSTDIEQLLGFGYHSLGEPIPFFRPQIAPDGVFSVICFMRTPAPKGSSINRRLRSFDIHPIGERRP